MLALDQVLEFDPARGVEFFRELPPRAAVYRIEPRAEGASAYLRRTTDLRRSCRRLLSAAQPVGDAARTGSANVPEAGSQPGPRPRLNLREVAGRVRYRLTGSPFEQILVLYEQARQLFPRSYRERLRLAPPALLKLNFANAYPRCYPTQRVLDDGGFYFGPFPNRRTADDFAQEFLPLFKIRRCHIKIRRDPRFPGCIYSEMKMCLAPCFAGCTKPEYDVEVARIESFLASRGTALIAELESKRDRASSAEDFEGAAAVHKKREKVGGVLRHMPELPRQIGGLDAAILQPAAVTGSVNVFRVRGGAITDPLLVNFQELSSLPRSVETILRDYLEAEALPPQPGETLTDSLSLLARWFYSKPRLGEIFFREAVPPGGWPYRRILRGCARVLGPQELLPPGPAGARPEDGAK